MPIKSTRGQRFVGGYIGSDRMRGRWLDDKIATWVEGVKALSMVARKYPQSAYYGFVNCLQAEWQYVCRCCEGIGHLLKPIEVAIREEFIPALFGGLDGAVDDNFRRLLANGVKAGGMALRNPCDLSDMLYKASTEATSLLVNALNGGEKLNNSAHKKQVKQASKDMRKAREELEQGLVDELSAAGGVKVKKRLDRMKEAGSWIQAAPDRFDGSELSNDEWHDNITTRYGMRPKGLPQRCDGCNAGFSVEHGLSCKKGGLVVIRHDDLRDEYEHLCGLALSPSRVNSEPTILYGNGTSARRGNGPAEAELGDEARGDVYAHGLWRRGTGCVMDCRITDTDAKSYGNVSSAKILARHEREKKKKYEEACKERRRTFVPLVYSVDGMPGKAARSTERRIASLLAAKWDRQYSEMCCFVRRRIALSIARSTTLLLRGDRSTSWKRRAPEDGAAATAASTLREG